MVQQSENPAAPRLMTAARVHRFGPPGVITMERIEVPMPGEDEVRVHVRAAGVGPWDGWIRAGRSVLPQPLPLTLGSDISGVVESAGDAVTDFIPGDAVYGATNARFTGGYAEYAVASARKIARKPKSLSHIEAASVPVVAVTAWQMLFDHARMSRGQTVFVHGGGGNVGGFAVQLARRNGLRVIASAFDQDAAFVRDLGAGEVINTNTTDLEEFAQGADAVIDTVGGPSQDQLFALARPGGVIVSSVSQPSRELAQQHGLRAVFFLVDVNSVVLASLAGMFDSGELAVAVGTVLPLAEARRSHEMLEGRVPHPRGKIVLEIGA